MHACDLLETSRKLAGSMPGTSFLSTSVNWFPHLVVYLDFLGTIIGSQHFFPLWHMLLERKGSSIQKQWVCNDSVLEVHTRSDWHARRYVCEFQFFPSIERKILLGLLYPALDKWEQFYQHHYVCLVLSIVQVTLTRLESMDSWFHIVRRSMW